VSKLSSLSILQNLKEILSDPKWREAMQEEMKAPHKSNTLDFVELHIAKKVV
jgi:hypothetical protein